MEEREVLKKPIDITKKPMKIASRAKAKEQGTEDERNEAKNQNLIDCRIIQGGGTSEEIKAASERLIKRNDGLIKKLVFKYNPLCTGIVEQDDIYISACLGLLRAARTYDPETAEFSTYATIWMKQHIMRDITSINTAVRIPAHAYEAYRKARKKYPNDTGTKFYNSVMADKTMSDDQKNTVMLAWNIMNVDSLDRPVGESDDDTVVLGDYKQAETNVEDEAMGEVIAGDIRKIIKERLSQKELWIITHRFGLDGHAPWTLEQCGRYYPEGQVTRERIRQIEQRAVRKLRRYIRPADYPEYAFMPQVEFAE